MLEAATGSVNFLLHLEVDGRMVATATGGMVATGVGSFLRHSAEEDGGKGMVETEGMVEIGGKVISATAIHAMTQSRIVRLRQIWKQNRRKKRSHGSSMM